MCLEHEKMHQETLCYMLAQQQKQFWETAHLDSTGNLVVQNGISCPEPLARVSLMTYLANFAIVSGPQLIMAEVLLTLGATGEDFSSMVSSQDCKEG